MVLLLPQIYFLSLIPTATKRTSEKKTWWRSLSLRKEHFQKNPQLIILAPYKAGLLNNTPKLKSININNKYRRCRGRARVNQFNHFLYCTCIIAWTGLNVNPLSMITCEIEDNRHFSQIANIGIVQVADAALSGETLELPHELLAVNLIGSRIPFIGNPVAVIDVFVGLAENLAGADFLGLFM